MPEEPLDTLSRVLEIVRGLTVPTVTAGTPLLSTGLLDSLATAALVEELRQAFGVPLELEDLGYDNADTADQLATLVTGSR